MFVVRTLLINRKATFRSDGSDDDMFDGALKLLNTVVRIYGVQAVMLHVGL